MKGKKQYIIVIMIIISIIILDQIIKIYISKQNSNIAIINGILELTYSQNEGIAFGIGNNKNWIGIVTTDILVLFILLRFLVRQIENMSNISKLSISLILAGGFSNLIDRIIRKKVIDYINISPIVHKFPIFNVADIFIVVGFIIFVITIGIDLVKLKSKN